MRNADSVLPVEEIYTSVDVNRNVKADNNTGYTFNYPNTWLNSDSSNRMIGVRRLKIIPTANIFTVGLRVYTEPPDISGLTWMDWIDYVPTPHTSRPANWFLGEWTTQPTYIKDNPGDDEDGFEYVDVKDVNGNLVGWACVANAQMHQFRFRCTYDKNNQLGPYIIQLSTRQSNELVASSWAQTLDITFSITEENNLVEIIQYMINQFNILGNEVGYRFKYEYNYKTGKLSFNVLNKHNVMYPFQFRHFIDYMSVSHGDNADDINFFLNFLNQERSLENRRILMEFNDEKTFEDGVWNRMLVQFHASFSVASRQYIGINGDFWETPSRFFHFNMASTFNVRFSFDGIHYFIPRYSEFIIELSYVFNYKRVKYN